MEPLTMTTVGEICNRKVVTATAETTVAAAARLMRQYHVGSIVIVDEIESGGRLPVGIVTDRDLVVEVLAPDLDPKAITVGDIALEPMVTARESEGLLEAMEIMRQKGVRRLPVVNAAGYLVGIVSIDDLLQLLSEQVMELARIVAREQSREARARR
jgi:CBS domain-containing protein